ncbi:MAG: AAA family ATPase [Desulfobacteraceae bacterium]|nr:AAA family ATPase [Desulfobacteraceae bacterium]
MIPFELIKAFYEANLPPATWKGHHLVAPCPICSRLNKEKPGQLAVFLNPESYFRGYFKCTQGCVPGGYHIYFGQMQGIEGRLVPGHDPEADAYALNRSYPTRHLGPEIDKFCALMGPEQLDYFARFGISQATLQQLRIGFNGRYLIFPYIQENGMAYAARCIMPDKPEDYFFHGNEAFFSGEAALFNTQEISRCEGGALFITEGELNLLILKELGYPAVAVPSTDALIHLAPERLARVEHLFLLVANTPEARLAARDFAVRVGFKARILSWPSQVQRGQHLADLAADEALDTKKTLLKMIQESKAFSPFTSPEKEHRQFVEFIDHEKGKAIMGLETGFAKMDSHLEGLRGINILGGPPKAGKSCFFMQISTQVAQRRIPVIYYDFENGRQKIYMRTLVRLTGLAEKKIVSAQLTPEEEAALKKAQTQLEALLSHFRVVNDRQLTPDTMRRHIDFIKHETRKDELLIVVDSLHKLPFKDLTERRTGIDSWLRQLEAIRDEHRVCFLVISELSRGKGGGYGEKPDLSSFKESGDIEYSADNALILMPDWDPMAPTAAQQRRSILWVVASRESSPGKVADYVLDFPYWRFKEE